MIHHFIVYILSGAVGGAVAWFMPTQEERHEQCLKNIKRLERENKCLDVHNTVSQSLSHPWDELTR